MEVWTFFDGFSQFASRLYFTLGMGIAVRMLQNCLKSFCLGELPSGSAIFPVLMVDRNACSVSESCLVVSVVLKSPNFRWGLLYFGDPGPPCQLLSRSSRYKIAHDCFHLLIAFSKYFISTTLELEQKKSSYNPCNIGVLVSFKLAPKNLMYSLENGREFKKLHALMVRRGAGLEEVDVDRAA